MNSELGLFDCILEEDALMNGGSTLLDEVNNQDILSQALNSTGVPKYLDQTGVKMEDNWPIDEDASSLLDSLLRTSDLDLLNVTDRPLSDDGSDDSGLSIEQQLLSPSSNSSNDEIIHIRDDQDEEEDENPVVVDPVTNSPPIPIRIVTNPNSIQTGTTTIVLPVMNISRSNSSQSKIALQSPTPKRRRVSQSSNDSGLDDFIVPVLKNGKYPPLSLTEEEKRLCEREGVKLPSHYPLSREEEKNLKRIRRKIRNKVSAQDSRKRKKEYVDAMEDRVKQCSDQNDALTKKIQLLETQNKTLAGQLRRLQQIVVNGGLKNSTQTSTAMMVLLLSTALFLIPGFKDQNQRQEGNKCDLDMVNQAIKMPPMPGQSRSLLHFVKQETFEQTPAVEKNVMVKEEQMEVINNSNNDHDYFVINEKASSYIEEDAPPEGYGPGKGRKRTAAEISSEGGGGGMERRINVTRGPGNQGMRTVVLHVPNDIK